VWARSRTGNPSRRAAAIVMSDVRYFMDRIIAAHRPCDAYADRAVAARCPAEPAGR
jgi:hypothetical protein